MPRLTVKTLHALHSTVLREQIPRERLLHGLAPSFLASLRGELDPVQQILMDLHRLNTTDAPPGGGDPLRTWLQNARAFDVRTAHHPLVDRALAELDVPAARRPRPAATPPAPAGAATRVPPAGLGGEIGLEVTDDSMVELVAHERARTPRSATPAAQPTPHAVAPASPARLSPRLTPVRLGLFLFGIAAGAAMLWQRAPGRAARRPSRIAFTDLGAPMGFFHLPSGQYRMGALEGEGTAAEHPDHAVALSSFFLARTEVTNAQWNAVISGAQAAGDLDAATLAPSTGADDQPIIGVSWCDAVRFANLASRLEGLEPAYRVVARCDATWTDGPGFRLPTEAEWEYAARAGSITAYANGADEAALAEIGWYNANLGDVQGARPVCTRAPNPWGLCDLHGNVWEWVWDREGDYMGDEIRNPRGPVRGANRVRRGGSVGADADSARSAFRAFAAPLDPSDDQGFRLARSSTDD